MSLVVVVLLLKDQGISLQEKSIIVLNIIQVGIYSELTVCPGLMELTHPTSLLSPPHHLIRSQGMVDELSQVI